MKNERSPRLWRSLAEYDNDPEFQSYLENEFGTPLTDAPPGSKQRRRFMQLMGASLAMTGAAGCRWEQDKLVPMSRRPEGVIPGVPREYNTAMELGGVGVPLRVKSYDGRPIKVDGSKTHPDTLGASNTAHQGSVLGLYDPDRSRSPVVAGAAVEQADFEKAFFKHMLEEKAGGGAGLVVLAESSSSKSLGAARAAMLKAFPASKWIELEPVNRDNQRVGSQLAFGKQLRTHADLSTAKVVLSLDADFLASGPEALAQARSFAAARDPEAGHMNRLYVVESALTPTGAQADHRLALRSSYVKAFAAALENSISGKVGKAATQQAPKAAFLQDAKVQKLLLVLTKDLVANQGHSAVLAGANQSPEVHALAHRINALLQNVGKTITYSQEAGTFASAREGYAAAAAALASATTAIIIDGNPIYASPGDVGFEPALAKVKTSIHFGLYRDETAHKCTWHAPLTHYLEAWGDSLSFDGTQLVAQPLIAPLFGAKSAIEYLALAARDSVQEGQALVRRTLDLTDERAWRRAVHDGLVGGTAAKRILTPVGSLAPVKFAEGELGALDDSALELTFAADSRLYDGRFANNAVLQETPEPAMKLTWDNAAFINPLTAAALGIQDSHMVTVSVAGKSVELPALMSPAQARGSVRLSLGYGRTEAGVVAGTAHPYDADPVDPVGTNVYPLRSTVGWDQVSGATIKQTGGKFKLATTQDKHPMDDIGRAGTQERLPQIVRQDTFESFKKNPTAIKHKVHHPPLLSLWHDPSSYDGYKWGMTIDLNKCTGCNDCVMACNVENNIPAVGKDQVLVGRELHWMRIDRYFQGENADAPEQIHNQPVLCQHCEHAPCEQVCPVAATSHSSEGLNDMTYNRCIGTRYCSNNCPYKVRRFNYFNYNLDLKEEREVTTRMGKNPEVTIRFRGVMEKCSFCVQRIQNAKIKAKNARRTLKDQEVRTACQDVCSTQAIEFGDLNNGASKVAQKSHSPRGYGLLEELNVRPRITYLGRITNPHPDLAPAAAAHSSSEHETVEGKAEHHG